MQKQTPTAGGAAGALEDVSFATERPFIAEVSPPKQAASAGIVLRRDFVAEALKRHRERLLLDVKRGSLWAVAAAARCHLDDILWCLEEPRIRSSLPLRRSFRRAR